MKVINDTIHGQISLDGVTADLLSTPEMNKLSHIKQLGLAHLVFPGAHHTRFEHSLGVSHVGGMMADAMGLEEFEKTLVQVAGMLHDVGHGPYSHTLEHILHERGGLDHMSITEGIILGEYDVLREGEETSINDRKRIPEILESYDIEPEDVDQWVFGAKGFTKEAPALKYFFSKFKISDFQCQQTMRHLGSGTRTLRRSR